MGLPLVIQTHPLLHPVGHALIDGRVELRTASEPRSTVVAQEGRNAVGLIARGPARISAETFDAMPGLLVASATGSGADCVDVVAASERGIPVLHNPGVAPIPVAEYVIGSMLTLLKRLPEADQHLRSGGPWESRGQFVGQEAAGRILGLVGFGHIGRAVARRALALDMRVVAFSPTTPQDDIASQGVEPVPSLESLLKSADVVSLHVPLRSDTRGMIGAAQLAHMSTDAILINTSRGAVVEESALLEALSCRAIRAAAIDVFDPEPPIRSHRLYDLPNVLVTPHIAGLTDQGMERLTRALITNLLDALAGNRPPHLVDRAVWPPVRLSHWNGVWPLTQSN